MKKTRGLLALGLAASLLGCKKQDDAPTPTTPAPTKTDLLTGKNWVMSAATMSPGISLGTVSITDAYSVLPACYKDDILRFDTPDVFNYDEGASKCDPANPQTATGTWAFNADQTVLTTTKSGTTKSYTVKSLTATALVVSSVETIYSTQQTVTATFSN